MYIICILYRCDIFKIIKIVFFFVLLGTANEEISVTLTV